MKKQSGKMIAIVAIIVVMFSIIAFLVPFPKGVVFWIAYIAELIAFALLIPFFKIAFDQANTLKSRVLGFPIVRVGYLYLAVQTAVSLALFILGWIPDFPVWLALLICVLILCVALICGMSTEIAREEIALMERQCTVNTAFIRNLRVRSSNLVNKTDDPKLKQELERLAEAFRYSDPVSSEPLSELECNITLSFEKLENAIAQCDKESAQTLCACILKTLYDRNVMCKLSKGTS